MKLVSLSKEKIILYYKTDSDKEEYYFSVIISALTDNKYQKLRNYWKRLKGILNEEGC